jgi:hypothetical protein
MELALETSGALATLRVLGDVKMDETKTVAEYLRVARENGAIRCILDLSSCGALPTTALALLMRESALFAEAGGALSLSGVKHQNPFLTEAVASARFFHYATLEEACEKERLRALAVGP